MLGLPGLDDWRPFRTEMEPGVALGALVFFEVVLGAVSTQTDHEGFALNTAIKCIVADIDVVFGEHRITKEFRFFFYDTVNGCGH